MRTDGFFIMRPQLYQEGLEDMISYINNIRPTSEMRMIEIGSYIGESTMQFAKHFKEVVSVDPFINDYDPNDAAMTCARFERVYNMFLYNTLPYTNIKSVRNKASDAVELLSEYQWDFVYIDGIHTYDAVKEDIQNYKGLIKPGGFLAGHDYSWDGVKRAVDENCIVDATFKDTSWIVKI